MDSCFFDGEHYLHDEQNSQGTLLISKGGQANLIAIWQKPVIFEVAVESLDRLNIELTRICRATHARLSSQPLRA